MSLRVNLTTPVATLAAAILATFALTSSSFAAPAAATKKPTAKKVKPAKKTAKNKNPIGFLPFDRIGTLTYVNRVKYVKALRGLMIEAETAQNVFHKSVADLPAKHDGSELYAMLFGETANAASYNTCVDKVDGGRGLNPTDRCISAWGLSQYPTSGRQQPFLCEQEKCLGKSGAGVRCQYSLSGVPPSDPESCVPRDIEYKSTVVCDGIRARLTSENENKIERAVDDAEKFFGFMAAADKRQPVDLAGAGTRQVIHDLLSTAYDDRSMAMLIRIIGVYKRHNTEIPLSNNDADYNVFKNFVSPIKASGAQLDVEAAQEELNDLFGGYLAHCEHCLEPKVVNNIANGTYVSSHSGAITQDMENARKDAYNKLTSGVQATVENVLEVPECATLKQRYAKLTQDIQNIASTTPNIGQEPPPPPEDTDKFDSTGCNTNVGRAEDHLKHPAARCMVCLADQAMQKEADKYGESTKEYDYRKYYSTSKKWLALMSTMVLACGDGVADNTAMQADVMACYMEAFGHCSNDTYAWDPTGKNDRADGFDGSPQDISSCDNWLVDKWSDRNFWTAEGDQGFQDQYMADYKNHGCGNIRRHDEKNMDKGKLSAPDMNNDFVRVYGIKYDEAVRIFCDPSKFKRNHTFWIFGHNGPVKTFDASRPLQQCSPQWIDDARKRMSQNFELKAGKDNPPAQALLACLKDSYSNANELYSSGQNYCIGTQHVQSPDALHDAMANAKKSGQIPGILFDTGSCYIAAQYESDVPNKCDAISFVDPRTQAAITPDSKNGYNTTNAQEIGSLMRKVRVCDDPTAKNAPSNAPKKYKDNGDEVAECKNGTCDTGHLQPSVYQYFSYSYADPGACTAPHDSSAQPVSEAVK